MHPHPGSVELYLHEDFKKYFSDGADCLRFEFDFGKSGFLLVIVEQVQSFIFSVDPLTVFAEQSFVLFTKHHGCVSPTPQRLFLSCSFVCTGQ